MKMIASKLFSLSPTIQTVDQEEHSRFVRDHTHHDQTEGYHMGA